MGTVGTVVVVVLGVALLAALVVLAVRSRGVRSAPSTTADPAPRPLTWPSIGLSAAASAACFVLAGVHVTDSDGPGPAIIGGGVAGILCLVAVIAVLLPSRRTDGPPPRLPLWFAAAGTVVGAVALLVSPLSR